MASYSNKSSLSRFSFRQKTCVFFLFLVSLPLLLYTPPLKSQGELRQEQSKELAWFDVIARDISTNKIKVGMVNIDEAEHATLYKTLNKSYPQVSQTVSVKFDRVDGNMKWKDFFPTWIDEDHKWGVPKCPHMPMPKLENYQDVNVVVARVPCGNSDRRGVRDLFRLQVNLVVANLAVEGGLMRLEGDNHRKVYVVFIGSCGPMIEIFRCDDLLMRLGEYWVYKPELTKLKQKTLMPPGSCQIAPAYAQAGKF